MESKKINGIRQTSVWFFISSGKGKQIFFDYESQYFRWIEMCLVFLESGIAYVLLCIKFYLFEPCHQIISLFSFIFSIFVCSALGNILGKFGVPYLTFPFNLLAIVTFLSLQTIYPALPKEEVNALGYNCTSLETGFVVNKKTNSILQVKK